MNTITKYKVIGAISYFVYKDFVLFYLTVTTFEAIGRF
jgi:hypothetical protein